MSFAKHIKELNRKIIHNTPEFLGQNSQYRLDKMIHNYSTDSNQAYTLTQINASHNIPQFYCLTPRIPQITDFSRFISFYNLGQINSFLNIVDYGITKTDGKEIFGVVLPYIEPEKLLSNNLHLFENKSELILQHIIIPILEALVQIHNSDVTHGSINQENIWIVQDSDTLSVVLSNTCLDLPGYNQNPIYEPLNRMLVHRSGKTCSKSADCYAVGILLASLLGCKPVTRKGYESTVTSKAKIGSYETVIDMFFNGNEGSIDDVEKSILYWLLHHDENKRWNATGALKFLRRRHRRITVNNALKSMVEDKKQKQIFAKSLTFSGEECYSMTEAAVSSIRNYDEIRIRVKNGKLVKELLDNDSIKPDFISKISILRELDGFTGNNIMSKEDMFLTAFIILMDKSMPIKLKDLAVEPNAVWQMSRYVSHRSSNSTSNLLNKAIYGNLISKINQIISTTCGVEVRPIKLPDIEIIKYFSEASIMSFINSYSEPNSPYVFNDQICFSVGDILEVLNGSEMSIDELITDENLIGYVIGKLSTKSKLELIQNSVLEPTQDHFAMFFLIISACHNISGKKPLKNLSNNLYKKLSTEYIGKIKYLKLRKKVNESLKTASDSGHIYEMHRILNLKEIDRKNEKYLKVLKKVETLNTKINQRHDKALISEIARQQTIRLAGTCFIAILLFILYKIS